MTEKTKQISLIGLIMMLFTTIYGFANTTVAYDQMGYASIIWYVISALLFMIPSSLMFAEYGSAFKDAKGGIYSWLAASIGERLAFIGTFIWLASWVVWMVSTAAKIWIPFSTVFAGYDATQTWTVLGWSSTQVIGVLGIFLIIGLTWSSVRGVETITKFASVGGFFVSLLTVVFLLASLIVWFSNHGQLAEPIHGMKGFLQSPSTAFQSPIALASFAVYAVFAYAGAESLGGVIDSVKHSGKNFPKGLIIGTIFITVAYSLIIFMWGVSANWQSVVGAKGVNLGNITYVLMSNLGSTLGHSLGLSATAAMGLGAAFARFTGLSMFLAYIGSFSVLVYSPLKSFIMGSNPDFWPKKMTQVNQNGMPAFAMWVQAGVVVILIALVSFGGAAAAQFYTILTDMANVSTSFPYLFLIGAFPFFKRRQDLDYSFHVYNNRFVTDLIVTVVMIVLVAGIGFSCAEPLIQHDYVTAFWTIIGPVFFGLVAWGFLQYQQRAKRQSR
ncbi:glutamate/gamma-aminobutyrate family transporter YjeM [uncultured Secundilactobacillus sp.]|uniref:glutamate/gamma-aminobutyrate family transporter YjeM n=1 Tax=uncultured Secundilactobacillus sp. TaxID=2813935 RepID=UPI0025977188|nr:glutamate/gamma-aminobutyrate family transporter YjeM [uncultured Secundilactobacillus sp.]